MTTTSGKSFYFWRSKANYFEVGQKRISQRHTFRVHAGQYHALAVEDLCQPGCTRCRLLQSKGVMLCSVCLYLTILYLLYFHPQYSTDNTRLWQMHIKINLLPAVS